MKIVCLDAITLGDIDFSQLKKLGDFIKYDYTTSEQTIDRLQNVDIVITNKVIIDKDVMDNTNLKLICVAATGTNNIDMQYAKQKGIVVKNVAGYSTNSVVQQTFASLLFLTNHCGYYDKWVKDGKWSSANTFTNVSKNIYEISGKKFGIIGLGTIGQQVAKIATAFGADVMYYSTSGVNNSSDFKKVSLDELLSLSDIISIHCALNDKTLNLIDKKELLKLKSGAIIMNFGRGGIINESALAHAIDTQDIYVALDVISTEPMPRTNPLNNIKNTQRLFITPHIAWASMEARKCLIEKILENIQNFLKG